MSSPDLIASLEARIAALEAPTRQLEETAYLTVEDANAFWLLFGMILVFFMQAGFAMVSSPFRLSKPLSPRPRWPCCVRSDELTEPSPPPSLSTPPPDPPRAWPRSSAPAVCGAKTP